MRRHLALFVALVLVAVGAALIVISCDQSPRPVCYSVLHGGQSRAPAAAQQSNVRGGA